MKLVEITESNPSTILKWAIENHAKLKRNLGLADIISDDMKYILTFEDVNFLELYRLSEIYRSKLKIIKSNEIRKPSDQFLEETFQGSNTDNVKYSEIAKNGIQRYIDVIQQIDANRTKGEFEPLIDILLIPMICRTFTIQIPLRFIDFVFACNEDELERTFNQMYPETLDELIGTKGLGFENQLMIQVIKTIGIKPYEPKTIKYLDITKFNKLQKKTEEQNFYDPVLLSFARENKITGKKVKFSFFKTNKEELERTLKKLKKLDEPTELEFAVSIPIEYMQQIQNNYSDDTLEIGYRSSFETTVSNGFNYQRIIKIRDYEDEIDEPIDLYGARLHEAALSNSVAIAELAKNAYSGRDNVINLIDIYSLLPSVYTTQVVFKVLSTNIKKLMTETNPFIKALFTKFNQQYTMLKTDMDKI